MRLIIVGFLLTNFAIELACIEMCKRRGSNDKLVGKDSNSPNIDKLIIGSAA